MVKAPKQLWLTVQNNDTFIDLVKEIDKLHLDLNMVCEDFYTNDIIPYSVYRIYLNNSKWKCEKRVMIPRLMTREEYEKKLSELEKQYLREENKSEAWKIHEDIITYKILLGMEESTKNQKTYEQYQNDIKNFPQYFANVLKEMLDEYKNIKFCVNNMELF